MSKFFDRWKGIVGVKLAPADFDLYVRGLEWGTWKPRRIVMHNTASPSLAQRPNGLMRQHIENLESYYRKMGWSAGPHLFIDDLGIWVFTPLTTAGVHSPSFNSTAIGIEMLGDFARESTRTGRGARVVHNAVMVAASLCHRLTIDSSTILLHKEDRKTTHDCPGKNFNKDDFIRRVHDLIVERRKEREG